MAPAIKARGGINGTQTLQAFNQSDAVWNGVVTCMKDVFAGSASRS